jgi:1-acyl-sn-glycerol-3-phosphate acyltransferase
MGVMRPVTEVRGLDPFPPGGALVVGNYSGGMFPMDVPIFSVDFYEKFGYDRAVYTLSHDILFMGLTGPFFRRAGYIQANPENAATALRSGGVVVVFPGGDYDAYRPTFSENVIDFNGRKGYVRTAIEAGVPMVPAVSGSGAQAARSGELGQLQGAPRNCRPRRASPAAAPARSSATNCNHGLAADAAT